MSGRIPATQGAKPSAKRTYAPTTKELNEAIEDYLHQQPKANVEDVRVALIKSRKTWFIPDRRLKKFVKRHKAGEPMTADDDNTVSMTPGQRFKGMFTIGNNPAAKPATSKKSSVKVKAAKAALEAKKAAAAKKMAEEAVKESAPVPEIKPEISEKAAPYLDDNDGAKEKPCVPCEGCAIL